MWTFSFRYLNESFTRQWCVSGRRFDKWKDAWEAAGEWSYVNYINDEPIEVRLEKIVE